MATKDQLKPYNLRYKLRCGIIIAVAKIWCVSHSIIRFTRMENMPEEKEVTYRGNGGFIKNDTYADSVCMLSDHDDRYRRVSDAKNKYDRGLLLGGKRTWKLGRGTVRAGIGYERMAAYGTAGVNLYRRNRKSLDSHRTVYRNCGKLGFHSKAAQTVYYNCGQCNDAAGIFF